MKSAIVARSPSTSTSSQIMDDDRKVADTGDTDIKAPNTTVDFEMQTEDSVTVESEMQTDGSEKKTVKNTMRNDVKLDDIKSSTDAELLFGLQIANELRRVKDGKAKRLCKLKIQQALFDAQDTD